MANILTQVKLDVQFNFSLSLCVCVPGVAGFVEFQSLSVPGALWARVFHTHSSTPFLLINAGDRLVLMKAHMIGSALHSFRKGVCYPPEVDLL